MVVQQRLKNAGESIRLSKMDNSLPLPSESFCGSLVQTFLIQKECSLFV